MKLFLTGRRATHSQVIPIRDVSHRVTEPGGIGGPEAQFTPKTRRLKRSAHSVPVKKSPCPLPGEVFGQIRGLSSRSESSRRKARGGIASENFRRASRRGPIFERRCGEPQTQGQRPPYRRILKWPHPPSGNTGAATETGKSRSSDRPARKFLERTEGHG
jgi:hypothetical protein